MRGQIVSFGCRGASLEAAFAQGDAVSTITNGTTITSTITLSNSGSYTSPLTIQSAGAVLVNSGFFAISGSNAQPWTVTNYGTVSGGSFAAIALASTSVVSNLGTGALIESVGNGVEIENSTTFGIDSATVINSGTILSSNNSGVRLLSGYVDNTAGLIEGRSGVYIAGGTGLVENAATIEAVNGFGGVVILHDGTVANAASGLIVGSNARGVYLGPGSGLPSTVINVGTIVADHAAVFALRGGNFANSETGLIEGSAGISVRDGAGTVTNAGTIIGTGFYGGRSSEFNYGIYFGTTPGIVNNSGTIVGAKRGVEFYAGGSIGNTGLVLGYHDGIAIYNAAGTVTNSGAISQTGSSTTGAGIYFGHGGLTAIEFTGTPSNSAGIVTNPGTVIGATGIKIGSSNFARNTIVNVGTITGTDGIAISLGGGASEIVIENGSQLNGAVGNFLPGDSIDLPFLPFAPGGTATVGADNVLTVSIGGAGSQVALDPSQDFTGDFFHVAPDGSGGTRVTEQPTPFDFTRNGDSDILWRGTDGNVAMWQMNGFNVASQSIFAFADPADWTIRGAGDFSGDGRADILWGDASGNIAVWSMLGSTVVATDITGFADPAVWSIAATGDFNGDGFSDILWRGTDGNVAIWDSNGTTIDATAIVGFAGPTWHIRGAGDFNGDGMSDILWQNDNGSLAIWEMNGFTVADSALFAGVDPSVWHIRGTGDFNGDGFSDILWQDNSGDVAIWEMNGLSRVASDIVGFANPTQWHMAGTGDFNDDGKSDILWQDNSGNVAVWEMNGFTIGASALVGFANPGQWHIVPPDSTGSIPGTG